MAVIEERLLNDGLYLFAMGAGGVGKTPEQMVSTRWLLLTIPGVFNSALLDVWGSES